mgnify:FL=1
MFRYTQLYWGITLMTLSNELFFGLFSLLIVVTVVWFVRNAAAYKKWVKQHYANPRSQLSEKRH